MGCVVGSSLVCIRWAAAGAKCVFLTGGKSRVGLWIVMPSSHAEVGFQAGGAFVW